MTHQTHVAKTRCPRLLKYQPTHRLGARATTSSLPNGHLLILLFDQMTSQEPSLGHMRSPTPSATPPVPGYWVNGPNGPQWVPSPFLMPPSGLETSQTTVQQQQGRLPPQNPKRKSKPPRNEAPDNDSDRAEWTDNDVQALLEQLIESSQQGQWGDGAPKKPVITACRREIEQITGSKFTEKQIRNKIQSLKNRWSLIVYLLNKSGFGWNDELKMIIAADDVWDDEIKVSIYPVLEGWVFGLTCCRASQKSDRYEERESNTMSSSASFSVRATVSQGVRKS